MMIQPPKFLNATPSVRLFTNKIKQYLAILEAMNRGSGVIHKLQGIGEQAQLGTVTLAPIPILITTERRETLNMTLITDNEV